MASYDIPEELPMTARPDDYGWFPGKDSLAAAVDKGIEAAKACVAREVGIEPDADDAFWADGHEREHLITIAHKTIYGGPWSDPDPINPRNYGHGPLAPMSHNIAGLVNAHYVGAVSRALGLNYKDMPAARERLGGVFSRYVSHEINRRDNQPGAPRL